MGIFLATVARSMPQLGLLVILLVLPLNMLSGGYVPRESMPKILQNIMQIAPSTHFVSLAQAILYRGAGFDVVWLDFIAIIAIGAVFFFIALARFRKTITLTQVWTYTDKVIRFYSNYPLLPKAGGEHWEVAFGFVIIYGICEDYQGIIEQGQVPKNICYSIINLIKIIVKY